MLNFKKKYAVFYISILTILLAAYEIFSPLTYPILLLLTGNGRFNDWYLSLDSVSNYPKVVDTICTIPWVYAFFLSGAHDLMGNFFSHIFYITLSILIFSISYNQLNNYLNKVYSFLLIFSYPVMFGFWRGNTDFIIYSIILACYFYGKNNEISKSLIFLGSAIAFKPYQIFLLLAYRVQDLRKNYLIFIFGGLGIVILILLANKNFFTSSYLEIIKCGRWYIKEYAIGDGGTLHNNSLWGLFKLLLYYSYQNKIEQSKIIEYFSVYLDFWPILLLLIFYFLNFFVKIFDDEKSKFSSKFFLVSLLITLLSPIVPDYRLFFINICLIIVITSRVSKDFSKHFIIGILIFILIPKEFIWFNLSGAWFTPNGAINCISMLILLFYIIIKSVKFNLYYPIKIRYK